MKAILTTTYILFFFSLFSQEEKKLQGSKYSIKIYNSTYRDQTLYTDDAGIYMSGYTGKFISPSFAFALRTKKGNFHELEVSGISYRENIEYYTTFDYYEKTISFSGRYEYYIGLSKNTNKRFRAFIGGGSRIFLEDYGWKSDLSKSVPFGKYNTYFIDLALTPRLIYYTRGRFYFDLNTPIVLYKYAIIKEVDDGEKTIYNGVFNFRDLGAFTGSVLRVGIGYNLSQ